MHLSDIETPPPLEKRLFPPCRNTPNPQVADPNGNTLSSNTQVTFHSLGQSVFCVCLARASKSTL